MARSGPHPATWFITGPTASGKSDLALALAERFGGELLAVDSMTFYRGLDIGTAKPSADDRARVPHHLIDVLDPDGDATVDWFVGAFHQAEDEVVARNRRPIGVGGTPLYLKALLRGLFDGPDPEPERRARLEREASELGSPALHARLMAIDPIAAARIAPTDPRRIIRALEVFEQTGRPISAWQEQFRRPASPRPKVACLVRPRDELVHRIERRIDIMLSAGWLDEVRRLQTTAAPMSRGALQAVGYRELAEHLAGRLTLAEARERIIIRTRQFAKHQMTWFRHLEELTFFETRASEPFAGLLARVEAFLGSDAGG